MFDRTTEWNEHGNVVNNFMNVKISMSPLLPVTSYKAVYKFSRKKASIERNAL